MSLAGPLLPSAMTFSRRATYSERASSSTRVLLSEGMAVKSKLSRLLTAGNLASLIRRSTLRRSRFDHLQFRQSQQVTGMVDSFGGALAGQLVVLAQEGRQPQCLQVMGARLSMLGLRPEVIQE